MTLDQGRLEELLGRFVNDFGAAGFAATVVIGDKLGLYRALAAGPATPAELADRTSTHQRYVAEWLAAQAASGYVTYDPTSGRFWLSEEQEFALAHEDNPIYLPGAFQVMVAAIKDEPKVTDAFRSGTGVGWHEHDPDLFAGTERFFRPGYAANLVSSWIPALDGVQAKLEAGALVADVGCGHGASTVIMAQAYPNSRFYGFDNHAPSIEHARRAAEEAGVADRVTFEVASADAIPGGPYDLVCFFDCLHDMGDPAGAARRAAEVLAEGGSALIVEPMAGNSVEENLNIVGRTFSAASTLCCTANSLALGGPALGAVAADDALREVVTGAGFKEFRRATQTPFNRVFEARK